MLPGLSSYHPHPEMFFMSHSPSPVSEPPLFLIKKQYLDLGMGKGMTDLEEQAV